MTNHFESQKKEEYRQTTLDEFSSFPQDLQDNLMHQALTCDSFEEFWRQAIVGDCPFCGSEKTMDCGDTFRDDNTLGVCFDCHKIWCLECGEALKDGQRACEHWAVCEKCESGKAADGCGIPIWECPIIEDWKRSLTSD